MQAYQWDEKTKVYFKRQLAKSFGRAAAHYDGVAKLQRAVGAQLLEYLNLAQAPEKILDLGSGTGHIIKQLRNRYATAKLYGLDLAYGALEYAKQDPLLGQSLFSLCADAEYLPIKANSIDLITSNLMLQWCIEPSRALKEIYRVLVPKGTVLLSTLGKNTLMELGAIWRNIDRHEHIHRFTDYSVVLQILQEAGFCNVKSYQSYYKCYFPNHTTLINSVKQIGASNVSPLRRKGLMSKTTWQQLIERLKMLSNEQGLIPSSYEIIIVQASRD